MKHIQIHCSPSTPLDLLETLPLEHLYILEDEETLLAGGWISPDHLPLNLPFSHRLEFPDDAINWEEQWKAFAPDFREGHAHIPLSSSATLLLQPGAGFGDLSHPTTRLTLKLLTPHALETTFLDIGCGSGILALSALLLGAKRAIGLDCDLNALSHAADNAALNNLSDQVFWTQTLEPLPSNEPLLIAMNMIFSEQQTVWPTLPTLSGLLITSGILTSQREAYLSQATAWDWQLLEEAEEEGWMGFVWRTSQT